MSMDPSVLSRLLAGTRILKADEAATLSRIFGAPLDEVYFRFGMDPPAGKEGAKIVGIVEASHFIREGVPRGLPRSAPLPWNMSSATVAVLFQTRDAQDGWITYFIPQPGVAADAVGRWVPAPGSADNRFQKPF